MLTREQRDMARAEHREKMRLRRIEQSARYTQWQSSAPKEHLNLRANERRARQIASGMLKVSA